MTWWNRLKSILIKKAVLSNAPLFLNEIEVISEPWWENFPLHPEETKKFTVGPHSFSVERKKNIWSTATQHYILTTQQELLLSPVLSERFLAPRLPKACIIPPNKETVLYLSYPVWIALKASSPLITIEELSSASAIETWFGPNTREGHLCYSIPFTYAVDIAELNYNNYHIVTPLYIYNHSDSALVLEQLLIPTPYLSIFADMQNHLWTEQITLRRIGNNAPEIEIMKGAPTGSIQCQLLCPPRLENKLGGGLQTFLLWMRI